MRVNSEFHAALDSVDGAINHHSELGGARSQVRSDGEAGSVREPLEQLDPMLGTSLSGPYCHFLLSLDVQLPKLRSGRSYRRCSNDVDGSDQALYAVIMKSLRSGVPPATSTTSLSRWVSTRESQNPKSRGSANALTHNSFPHFLDATYSTSRSGRTWFSRPRRRHLGLDRR